MRINHKIFLSSLVPILLGTTAFIVCLFFYASSVKEIDDFFEKTLQKQIILSRVYNELGYSNGIHAFKNFVIRGNIQYHKKAQLTLNQALKDVQKYEHFQPLSPTETNTLKAIKKTIKEYLSKNDLALQLKTQGVGIKEIDAAVKVDDSPASNAIMELQKEFDHLLVKKVENFKMAKKRFFGLVLIVFLISLILAAGISGSLSKGVMENLSLLKQVSKNISKGKHSSNNPLLDAITEHDVKEVATNLQKMATSLDNTVLGLKNSNEDLEHFSYIAAHDLQEPTRKISNFADLLEVEVGSSLSEECNEYIEKIRSCSRKMSSLVRSLLEYSQLSKSELPTTKVDLNKSVQSAITDLELLIAEHNVQVEISNLPVVVGNEKLLNIVFYNMIANAIKFRKEGVTPVIKIYAKEWKQDRMRICVEDNGIGVKQQYYDKILTPFGRGHSSKTYQGFGLGLSMCKRILNSHDSELYISSEVDQGTTFGFSIKTA